MKTCVTCKKKKKVLSTKYLPFFSHPLHMIIRLSHLCKEVIGSSGGDTHAVESRNGLQHRGLCLTVARGKEKIDNLSLNTVLLCRQVRAPREDSAQ